MEEKYQDKKTSLLVIGNGFDLKCGLKSSYGDFFDSRIKSYSFIEQALSKNDGYWNQNRISDEQCIEDNLTMATRNMTACLENYSVWDAYFLLLREHIKNFEWYQIEEKIKSALLPSSSPSRKDYDFSCPIGTITYTKADLPTIGYDTNKGVKGVENPLIIFSEHRFLLTDSKQHNKLENAKEWTSFLLLELKIFEKAFGNYIKSQEKWPGNYYYSNAITLFANIRYRTKDIGEIGRIESFNYTEPKLDNIPIRHINGDCENPIFGIDFTDNDRDPEDCLFAFTKTNRRMELQFSNKYDSNRKDFDNLIIYGHSLNEQDYNYFFPIFDYLQISNAVKTSKVVFCYSIYNIGNETDEEARDRISEETRYRIRKLMLAYEKYLHPEKEHEMRLLDAITSAGRMKMIEI